MAPALYGHFIAITGNIGALLLYLMSKSLETCANCASFSNKGFAFYARREGLTWVCALYHYRQNSITLQIWTLLSCGKLPK